MKETSIQWLQERFTNFPTTNPELIAERFATAMLINECEIKAAYINGELSQYDDFKDKYKNADEYYNSKYKK